MAEPAVDQLELDFDALVRSDGDWQQLIASRVAAAAPEAQYLAWDAILIEAGLDEAHSVSFAWTFRQQVYPAWQYRPEAPELLSSTLPGYGRWTKATGPAPLP